MCGRLADLPRLNIVALLFLSTVVWRPCVFGYSPLERGISGRAGVHNLRIRALQQDSKRRAMELVREAHRLEQQGKLREALEKYRESLRLEGDPFIQEYVKALEKKLTQANPPSIPQDVSPQDPDIAEKRGSRRIEEVLGTLDLALPMLKFHPFQGNLSEEKLKGEEDVRVRVRDLKTEFDPGGGLEMDWGRLKEILLSAAGRPGSLSEADIEARIAALKSPLTIEELAFRLKPGEDLLVLESMKNLRANLTILGKKKQSVPRLNRMLHIANLSFKDFDFSGFSSDAERGGLARILSRMEVQAENITLNIHPFALPAEKGMVFAMESLRLKESLGSGLMDALLSDGTGGLGLAGFLELCSPLTMELDLQKLSFTEGSVPGGSEGRLDSFLLRGELASAETGLGHRAGLTLNLGGLAVQDAQHTELPKLMNLQNLNLELGLDRVSSVLLKILTDRKPGDSPESVRRSLLNELGRTRPRLSIALDPLAHALGTLTMRGELTMTEQGAPEGQATAVLSSPSEFERRLRAAGGKIPAKTLERISVFIANFFRSSAYSEGRMTFEIRGDEPGFYYLNGEKKRF
jgi:hypothetical protein